MDKNTELTSLRVSLARLAQALSVNTPALHVQDMPYEVLYMLALTKDRGWNALAEAMVEKVQEAQTKFVALGSGAWGSGHGTYMYVFHDYNVALAFTRQAMLKLDPDTNDHYPISWDVYPCDLYATNEGAMGDFQYALTDDEEDGDA